MLHQTEQGIGFDSDCIDLRLSGPGSGNIDHKKFPKAEEQRQFLEDKGKKFILAQPPHVLYEKLIEYEQVTNAGRTNPKFEFKNLTAENDVVWDDSAGPTLKLQIESKES